MSCSVGPQLLCGSHFLDIHITGFSLAAATSNTSSQQKHLCTSQQGLSPPCPLPPHLVRSNARGKAVLLAAEQGQERGVSSEWLWGLIYGAVPPIQ